MNTQLLAANAALAKATADAKAAADKAAADLATEKAGRAADKASSDAAIKAIKDAFNALATKWNAKNPKAKVATLK